MCEKIPYGYKQAHELLNRIRLSKSHTRKKIPKRVYYCKEHRQWHLTSEAIRNDKKKRTYGELKCLNLQ